MADMSDTLRKVVEHAERGEASAHRVRDAVLSRLSAEDRELPAATAAPTPLVFGAAPRAMGLRVAGGAEDRETRSPRDAARARAMRRKRLRVRAQRPGNPRPAGRMLAVLLGVAAAFGYVIWLVLR